MNTVLAEDIDAFRKHCIFSSELKNCSFLITGVSGLIGGILARCLLALDVGIHVIAPVRDMKKVRSFQGVSGIDFIEGDFLLMDYETLPRVDYVIHCASPTASVFFVEKPVETAEFIIDSGIKLLHYCKANEVKGFLFLSSLEVYGEIVGQMPISEEDQGFLSLSSSRSSYPMAKRQMENLCALYAKEYNVNTRIARLTQTTGAGISDSDDRVIVQFVKKAVTGEDIVLHTAGLSSRPYLYTIDAVNSLLYILLRGSSGEVYNVACEESYISAVGLAEKVREMINPAVDIRFELDESHGYAPPSYLRLSTEKIGRLGWRPRYSLEDIILRLKDYMINGY